MVDGQGSRRGNGELAIKKKIPRDYINLISLRERERVASIWASRLVRMFPPCAMC